MADHNDSENLKNELLKKLADFGFAKDSASVTVDEALKAAAVFVDQVRECLEPEGEREALPQLRADSKRTLQQLLDRSKSFGRFHEGEAHVDPKRQEQLAAFRTSLLKSDALEIRPARGSSLPILFLLYKIQNSLEGGPSVGGAHLTQLIRQWEAAATPTDFDKTQTPELLDRNLAEAFELGQVKTLTAEVERLLRLLGEAKDLALHHQTQTDSVRAQVAERDVAVSELNSKLNHLAEVNGQSQLQIFNLKSEVERCLGAIRDLEARESHALQEVRSCQETVTKTAKEYEKQEDHVKYLEAKVESLTQDVAIKDRELHTLRVREESFIRRGRDLIDKSTLSFLKTQPTGPTEGNQTSFLADPSAPAGDDRSGFGNQELSGLIDTYLSAVKTYSNTVTTELTKISDAKAERNEQLRHLDTKIRVRQNEMKELAAAKAPLPSNLRQSPWQMAIMGVLAVIAVLQYWTRSHAPM